MDLDAQLRNFRASHRPARAMFAEAAWSYFVCGSGPETLLMLPGAPGIAEMAFAYMIAFERRYRVIAPSYPAAVCSLEQLLAGLEGLLAREASGPVHLVGASYSGMVAQYLLQRWPQHVASLLIGDTGVPQTGRAMLMRPALAGVSRLPRLGLHGLLFLALAYVLKGETMAHGFWKRYFKGIVVAMDGAELRNRVQVLIEMDEQGALLLPPPPWSGPTLLMETADDPLFSAAERAALRRRYPNAEIHIFYNRGHITALTRAPEYIAVMAEFLERHSRPTIDCTL